MMSGYTAADSDSFAEISVNRGLRVRLAVALILTLLTRPALAGPPYVSDDPEPTDTHHFEIYAFNSGTVTRGGTVGETGIDFNYGAAPDLQLTATVPAGFSRSGRDTTNVGLTNVELAAKYRFLHQDEVGLDVSVFPRLFLPSPSTKVGDGRASVLLPLWAEKDWPSGWSAFGGGGCVFTGAGTKESCLGGIVVTYLVRPDLQIGPELAYQSADTHGTPASTSLGMGARYDINDTYHVLAYVRKGVENATVTDQVAWYTAVLFTF